MVITNSNLNGVELSGAEVRLTGLNINLYGAVNIPSGYSFQTNSASYFKILFIFTAVYRLRMQRLQGYLSQGNGGNDN
jgi:hypothetical protein